MRAVSRRCTATVAQILPARSMATLGTFKVPDVANEPFKHYPPGSPERAALRAALDKMIATEHTVPCIVGGQEIETGNIEHQVMPTRHQHKLCSFHTADEDTFLAAASAAMDARKDWAEMPLEGGSDLV